MPGRGTLELGIWYTCRAHGLRVKPGLGVAPIEHTGGNAGRPCDCQVYVFTERREVSRAEVLAALAALTGEDGES